jgi:WD40 repeat protein/serine/threonine protein kinase
MDLDDADPAHDQFAEHLAAYDAALAAGAAPTPPTDTPISQQVAARLERSRACLDRLEEMWPRAAPAVPQEPAVPQGDEGAFPTTFGRAVQLGRFRIVRELGRGGCGIVFLAFDPTLRRHVALKMPRPEASLTREARQRFLREAQAAAVLDHPNLVPVYETGELGPIGYIVSAYCPGPTLAAWLKARSDPVGVQEAVQLVLALAEGVEHAHSRGVLHRDLKPGNVMLQESNHETHEKHEKEKEQKEEPRNVGSHAGAWEPEANSFPRSGVGTPGRSGAAGSSLAMFVPKITDFGMAKFVEGEGDETRSGTVLGTPRYMAPEQVEARRREIGPATDVYALGAILYEVLTGRPPLQAETDLATLRLVLSAEAAPLRRLRPEVSRDLEAVCRKCLEKDPRRRYPSAALLADDLQRVLDKRPTRARPLGLCRRGWNWARRRPAAAAALAAGTAAVLALVLAAFLHAIQLEKHNAELEKINHKLEATAAREKEQRTLAEAQALHVRRLHYVSQFRLMHQLREQGQVLEVLKWLDAQRPEPGQEDLRGFEWRYLKASCLPFRAVWTGHRGAVYAVAVSPDGKTVATGSWDQTVRLWDLETGRVRATCRGHSDWVERLGFSADGRALLSASSRGHEVKVWDVDTAAERFSAALPEDSGSDVKIAPDGKILAVAGARGILLIDLDAGKQRVIGERNTECLAFAPDGRTIAAGRYDSVRLWDVRTGKEVLSLPGDVSWVSSVTFSPDGKKLATGNSEHIAKLWDLAAGKLQATLTGHTAEVYSVAFSPDGAVLGTASHQKTGGRYLSQLKLWDVATGQERTGFERDLGEVGCFAFTRDGQTLAVGCADQMVKLLDLEPKPHSRDLPGHAPKETWSLAFSPDGSMLASAGDDHMVRLWDASTGEMRAVLAGHGALVTAVSYSPDGKTLASGSYDEKVKLWDAATGHVRLTLPAGKTRVRCLAFSAHAPLLAVGNQDKQDNTVRLWNLSTGEKLTTLAGHERSVRAVLFSLDGKTLVTASEDRTIVLWDTATWRQRQRLEDTQQIWCLALDRDGKTVASGHNDGSVRLWDLASGKVRKTLEGHTGGVHGVAFAPDGKTLATAGQDKTVKLWQVATGEALLTLKGHEQRVNAVAFSPDGRILASGSHDGAVKLWFAGSTEPAKGTSNR